MRLGHGCHIQIEQTPERVGVVSRGEIQREPVGSRTTPPNRVATEEQALALPIERGGARRVPRRVQHVESYVATEVDFVAILQLAFDAPFATQERALECLALRNLV